MKISKIKPDIDLEILLVMLKDDTDEKNLAQVELDTLIHSVETYDNVVHITNNLDDFLSIYYISWFVKGMKHSAQMHVTVESNMQ